MKLFHLSFAWAVRTTPLEDIVLRALRGRTASLATVLLSKLPKLIGPRIILVVAT